MPCTNLVEKKTKIRKSSFINTKSALKDQDPLYEHLPEFIKLLKENEMYTDFVVLINAITWSYCHI